MRALTALYSLCLWACGDRAVHAPDAASEPFQPAPHVPMPQMLPHNGTVLSSIQLVTVTFDGYAARSEVEAFGDAVVGSAWYREVGAEYGVNPGHHIQKLVLGPPPASLTRAAVRDLIVGLVADHPPPPPATASSVATVGQLYLLYVPPEVALQDPAGDGSYHDVVRLLDGSEAPIAVVRDRGDGVAATLMTAARQLIDAATDPYEPPNDGYYADPSQTDPWSLIRGEVADLCEGEDPILEAELSLPRVYSNHSLRVGLTPCKPFGPDDTWSDVSARPSLLQRVSPGSAVVYELTGWSTRQIPDWMLRTQTADRSEFAAATMHPEFSSDTINNRRTVTLTLHVPVDAASGSVGGVYVLSGVNIHPWAVGFVVE